MRVEVEVGFSLSPWCYCGRGVDELWVDVDGLVYGVNIVDEG